MGILTVTLTIGLLFCAVLPVARLWRSRAAAIVAVGVFAFGLLVLAVQFLGIISAATGARAVAPLPLLVTVAVACAIVWAREFLRRKRGEARGGPVLALRAIPAWPSAAAGAGAAFLSVAVSSALSAPPRGWDVLTYHLPRAAAWLLHGDLGVYGSTGAFYPGNAQLAILLLFFSGSDLLVSLVQLPFVLLGAVALYGLARQLGASTTSSSVPVLILLTSPIVFFQTTIAKDDLVVTALVAAFLFFLVRSLGVAGSETASGRRVAAESAVAGLALGLAVGTKYSILPFAIVSVAVVFGAHAWLAGRERCATGRAALVAGIFALGVVLPSAFWLIRNLAVTGNPIEPLSLSLAEWAGSSGLEQEFQFVPTRGSWWVFPMIDRHLKTSYSGSAGFGAAFAAFALPGFALLVWRASARNLGRTLRTKNAVVLASIVLVVVAWWFGKHHLPRFLLPAMALATVPAALVFDSVRGRARAVLCVVLAVAVLFSAAETLRVAFLDDDVTWSHHRGASREEFYHVPDVIYELPVGTRILLLQPTVHNYYQTFRYPLIGSLPGNEVLMEEDVGIGFDIKNEGALGAYRDLIDADIEYVFMRTIGVKPYETWFDDFPDLYEKVVDKTERSYPWYRVSIAVTPEGEVLGGGTVVTKMYRVISEAGG